MCGIQILVQSLCSVDKPSTISKAWAELTQVNSRRGPDYHGEITKTLSKVHLRLGAHVLHLRGPETQSQPITAPNGDILLWNGEIFDGLNIGTNNDGLMLMDKIQQLKPENPQWFILKALDMIEGPYAFVYLDKKQEKLWFSRDVLGRRSLLIRHWDPNTLLLSSVAGNDNDNDNDNDDGGGGGGGGESVGNGWVELPAQNVFCLDLLCDSLLPSSIATYQWVDKDQDDISVPTGTFQPTIPFSQVVIDQQQHMSLDPELQLENRFPLVPDSWKPYIDGLQNVLIQSIRQRVESIPIQNNDSSIPRVGILFSGGVDCITIAALLTRILPHTEPIELFNVSFENPRQTKAHGASFSRYNVPDRQTGIQGWKELCHVDPSRQWRFVQVDVPYNQVIQYRSHIRQLLVPSDTVMDMSIGMAIWFAARGIGNLVSDTKEIPYTGMAKVLLLGMGADEQLGGYSRHRSAWDRGGTEALGLEIRLDVQRIATRNLGRDDRVVSDNGKEARYPFLAASVVDYLSTVPISRKMDMRLPRGIGEKLLLRLLARRLGLTQASVLAKRAIQFGARTAKMESSNTKGQDSL